MNVHELLYRSQYSLCKIVEALEIKDITIHFRMLVLGMLYVVLFRKVIQTVVFMNRLESGAY